LEKQPKQNIALGEAAAVVEESIGSKKRIFHGAVRRKDAILELVPVDLLTR